MRPHRTTPVPLAPEGVVGLLSVRGRSITAYDIGPRLGLAPRPSADAPFGILIDSDSAPLCLLVDAVGEVGHPSPERLEPPPSHLGDRIRPFVAAAYRGPRNLFLVLTPEAIRP
jgi:purine-binding chemotaxis protein CheW